MPAVSFTPPTTSPTHIFERIERLEKLKTALDTFEKLGEEAANYTEITAEMERLRPKVVTSSSSLGWLLLTGEGKTQKTYRVTEIVMGFLLFIPLVNEKALEILLGRIPNAEKLLHKVEIRNIAYTYRTSGKNRFEHPSCEQWKSELHALRKEWIKNYPGFNRFTFRLDSKEEIDQLCMDYPYFASWLTKDPSLREKYFRWVIRDHNSSESFVLFPTIQKWLRKHYLGQRTGNPAFPPLKVEGRECKLMINGTYVTLGDWQKQIQFPSSCYYTLNEIGDEFLNKHNVGGKLEYLADTGVSEFYTDYPEKDFHLSSPDWYMDGPCLGHFTVEQVQKLFGTEVSSVRYEKDDNGSYHKIEEKIPVDGKNAIFVMRTSQTSPMAWMRTHSWADMYLPDGKGGYRLFDLGAYPRKYPVGCGPLFFSLFRCVLGFVQVWDYNKATNDRRYDDMAFGMTPKMTEVLMEVTHNLLRQSAKEQMVFQFSVHGCTKFVVVDLFAQTMKIVSELKEGETVTSHFEKNYLSPELEKWAIEHGIQEYFSDLYEVNPHDWFYYLQAFMKLLPFGLSDIFLAGLTRLWTGGTAKTTLQVGSDIKRTVSHNSTELYQTGKILHPGKRMKDQPLEELKKRYMPEVYE